MNPGRFSLLVHLLVCPITRMKTVNMSSLTSVKQGYQGAVRPLQHLPMKHMEIHKQYLKKKASNEATAKVSKET